MTLTVENISFSYSPGKDVLKDVSFRIKTGKTICVLGASGSGKSTLLKIIANLLPNGKKQKMTGYIHFDETTIDALKADGKLSYMFQEPTLMPNLTVRSNIELPSKIYAKSFHHSTDDTIRIVGLSASTDKLPKDLSGGMRTRTALARSFITQPKLLLLDEPFSSLDIGWKNSLYKELNILQQRDNTTIVMVTHDVDEAIELADKVIILSHDGNTIDEFEISDSNKQTIQKKAKEIILSDHYSFLNQK